MIFRTFRATSAGIPVASLYPPSAKDMMRMFPSAVGTDSVRGSPISSSILAGIIDPIKLGERIMGKRAVPSPSSRSREKIPSSSDALPTYGTKSTGSAVLLDVGSNSNRPAVNREDTSSGVEKNGTGTCCSRVHSLPIREKLGRIRHNQEVFRFQLP